MKNLKLFCIIIITVCFSSCFTGGRGNIATSVEQIDAQVLLQKADDMVNKGYMSVADNLYDDALRKFTLIDNVNGKAKCIAGKIKVHSRLKDKAQTTTLFRTFSLLVNGQSELNELFLITQIESAYFYEMYDSLLNLTKPDLIKELNIENQAAAISYRLNSLTKLQHDSGTEVEALKSIMPKLFNLDRDKNLENPSIIGFVCYSISITNYQAGNIENALFYANLALESDKEHSNSRGIADDLLLLGKIGIKNQSIESVENYYQRALDIYVALDDKQSAENVRVESLILRYNADKDNMVLKELREIYKKTKFEDVKSKVGNFLSKKGNK